MFLKFDNSVAIREFLRSFVAKQHRLNFEENTLHWEVMSTGVKVNYYFPDGKTFLHCSSILELNS